MRNFRELTVYNDGRILAKNIYKLTKALPQDERFGLTSQIRRCVVSIPANIAEGAAKESDKDFARYLQISLGSSYELASHLQLCVDLEVLTPNEAETSITEIQLFQRKLSSFINYKAKNSI